MSIAYAYSRQRFYFLCKRIIVITAFKSENKNDKVKYLLLPPL